MVFQFCIDAKVANEVKKELTEKAVSIRDKLLGDLNSIRFLQRSYAASLFPFGIFFKLDDLIS